MSKQFYDLMRNTSEVEYNKERIIMLIEALFPERLMKKQIEKTAEYEVV